MRGGPHRALQRARGGGRGKIATLVKEARRDPAYRAACLGALFARDETEESSERREVAGFVLAETVDWVRVIGESIYLIRKAYVKEGR